GGGHAYLSAPYGLYQTVNGYLALAMGDLQKIAAVIGLPEGHYHDQSTWFSQRDTIMQELGQALREKTTQEWVALLETAGIWCGSVQDYHTLLQEENFVQIGKLQELSMHDGTALRTTRSV